MNRLPCPECNKKHNKFPSVCYYRAMSKNIYPVEYRQSEQEAKLKWAAMREYISIMFPNNSELRVNYKMIINRIYVCLLFMLVACSGGDKSDDPCAAFKACSEQHSALITCINGECACITSNPGENRSVTCNMNDN